MTRAKIEAIKPESTIDSAGATHLLNRQQDDSTNYGIEVMYVYWLNHTIMTCHIQ